MRSISESIETIGSIIDELSIDPKKIAEFREQYEKISLRSRDPNFYLSMIGDFNSGKSTLINTLIKRRLLKVAHVATTAVPTYIYRGKSNRVVVKAVCDGGEKYDLTAETDISRFEKEFDIELPQLIDDRVALLTADRELFLKIKEVDIELPDDELASSLCIIDTPGVNPGADFAEKHVEITKQILNEKADAAIILFPADQAYTQAFEKFLKDNAEIFMKDAIFVVTMMDRVGEDERDDIVRFVKANLRNNFHLEDPQVLSCSAMLSGKDAYWTNNFKEFERSLMDKLTQNRQRIVTERLVKLSNELLSSMQSEILSQKNGFERRLSVLQNYSVPNLISVLADSRTAAISKFSEIQSDHDTAVNSESLSLENKVMLKMNAGLNACSTRSEVTKYVKESLASDIEAVCKNMYAVSAAHTAKLNNELALAVTEMVEKLKTYYGEIGGVLPENASLSASEQQITVADRLTELGGMIGDHEFKIDTAMMLGGAGLAALILAGLGPVGWIIGGVAALIGGDRLFVDSARGKVRTAVSEKIPDISRSIVQELCSRMRKNCGSAGKFLEAKEKELVSLYQPIYEEHKRRLNLEKENLICKIQDSERIQNRIKETLQQINQI